MTFKSNSFLPILKITTEREITLEIANEKHLRNDN